MTAGADIHALNTVRRHLSKVKGGRLAAACVGTTITLAISDVVGDDLHAIGSGPGVPDETTWSDAAAALERFGGDGACGSVSGRHRGRRRWPVADTPKPGTPSLARATARVIGSRNDAMEGARAAAAALGYHAARDARADHRRSEGRRDRHGWIARATWLARSRGRHA